MKLPRRNFLQLAAGAAALPAVSRIAWAQAYPSRPVHLIAPFAAGGTSDTVARLMGQWLSERLGQPFVTLRASMGGAADHRCGIGGHCRRSLAREAPCKAASGAGAWVA